MRGIDSMRAIKTVTKKQREREIKNQTCGMVVARVF